MRPHQPLELAAEPHPRSPLKQALTQLAPLIQERLEALKVSLKRAPLSFETNVVPPSLTALLEREELQLNISFSDGHVCFLIELYDHQICEVSLLLNSAPIKGLYDQHEGVHLFELTLDEFLLGSIECELLIMSGERVRFSLSTHQQEAS